MPSDRVTKAVLVVIAIFLGIIALRPLMQPETVQAAWGNKIDYIMAWPVGGEDAKKYYVLDTRNGDLWGYGLGRCLRHFGRFEEPGRSMTGDEKKCRK